MLLISTLFLFQSAAAQAQRAEDWARALVASEHYVTDDADARIAQWVGLVTGEPGHPLADLTLALIESTEPQRPVEAAQRVLSIPASGLHPLAAGRLAAMKASRALVVAGRDGAGRSGAVELFPEHLARASVIGPLAGTPWSPAFDALREAPGFGTPRPFGIWGRHAAWRGIERSPTTRTFEIDSACSISDGWALVSFDFEVAGGTGWIELDFGDARGPRWVSMLSPRESGFRGTIESPDCRVAFDDGTVREIDFLSAERSYVWRDARAWRDGHNRVMLGVHLGAGMDVAVRVLDITGRALDVTASANPAAALGAGNPAPIKTDPIVGGIEFLEALEPRGPHCEALLGYAKFRDGRYAEGFSHLDTALQLAPESPGIQAFASEALQQQSSLPDTWRRSRARELIEAALSRQPENVRMQIAQARILAPEDKEEEAIGALESLSARAPSVALTLELADLYEKLELEAQAEARLRAACEQAPQGAGPLGRMADWWDERGLDSKARELRVAAAALGTTGALDALADVEAGLGHAEEALAIRKEVAALTRSLNGDMALALEYEELRRTGEAAAIWARLEERYPNEAYFALKSADLARLAGDLRAEGQALARALAADPSNRTARERLGDDPAVATWRRFAVDTRKELEGFDPARWSDHVVRAIDLCVVHVFEDGAFDEWTHEYDIARDLEGCESLGRQEPREEMLSIATIKRSDGKAYEPVLVSNEYIMPALEPGDAVEIVSRGSQEAQADGTFRTQQWFFASNEMPFHLTRFVVSLPKSLGSELVSRNFAGEHEILDEGERVIHVFTARDVDRVVPEPGSPPSSWYLPWVAFRTPADRARIERELAQEVRVPIRLAPQLIEAAGTAAEGTESETQRAQALHRFVVDALDTRSGLARTSALAALLTRDGNGAFLYSALLGAVGIEHELVWSRGMDPAADPEPDDAFPGPDRWMNQLLVLVKPRDGEPAWCDLSSKTLPYGKLLANAPKAEAFSATRGAWMTTPDLAPAQRTGEAVALVLRLGEGREATADISLDFTGNLGYALKEQLREIPAAQMKRTVTGIFSRILPGLSVGEFQVLGLDDDAPAAFRAQGTHKRFLDTAGDEFVCKLPFPALELARIAGGEGERKLPFLLQGSSASVARARFELPAGRTLASEFPEVVLEFGGGRFRLAIEDAGPGGFTLVRELTLPAQVIPAADFPAFVAFTRKVDEAERVRLRFR